MRGVKRMEKWVLIYDGDCEFCRRQIRLVERFDTRGRIEAVSFQAIDLAAYGVTRDAAEQAMHVVSPTGRVWRGAGAARQVSKLLPSLRPLAWLFHVPGAMFVAERVYRWVAKRRHRFGCDSAGCRRGAVDA